MHGSLLHIGIPHAPITSDSEGLSSRSLRLIGGAAGFVAAGRIARSLDGNASEVKRCSTIDSAPDVDLESAGVDVDPSELEALKRFLGGSIRSSCYPSSQLPCFPASRFHQV